MPVFPQVVTITFDSILSLWNQLWPGRQSPIQQVSTMVLHGGYDMTIRSQYNDKATFYGVYNATGDLIGVFSGHPTSLTQYRARGLYVRPDYQRMGVGRTLVQQVISMAKQSGCTLCWCLPRVENVPFFVQCGFTQVSDPFTDGVEFGPNVYMTSPLV